MSMITAEALSVHISSKLVLDHISFTIHCGEAWAIVGPSGSGKSTLAKVIAGRVSASSGKLTGGASSGTKVTLVAQQHRHRNQTDTSATYYQARFDSVNSEEFPTVGEVLSENPATTEDQVVKVLEQLQISHLSGTRIINLSNGENKRFQLAKALLQNPEVLILDNPFVGLDTSARTVLHQIINQLIERGTTILLITPPTEIPERITHVMELQAGSVAYQGARASFLERPQSIVSPLTWLSPKALAMIQSAPNSSFEIAVRMQNVTIRYDGKQVLDGIDWQVNRGDKWALAGQNGAGKSTLLSLIYGDNPQAYANDITLFDQPKGSGESIWDIKRRIGYVSPELHLYVDRQTSCFKTVASGLTDTMIYDKRLSEVQKATIEQWLDAFELSHRRDDPLAALPLSEQRLVLLVRAMVKNPPVLILDEPCQGLDAEQTQLFKETVDAICHHSERTLIFVSHYAADVPSCVDQTLMLHDGKVSES